MRPNRLLLIAALCLLGLGSSGQAAEHVQDNLGLFSQQAVTAANQQIAQLYKKHGWMIAVETRDASESIPNLPQAASKQDEFLTSWTTKNYVENKLEGIYLVIFKNPNKFRFHIDTNQQRKMGVTQADINSWKNLLQENLRVKDYDAALLSTVGGMSAKLSRATAGNKALALPGGQPAEQGPLNKQPRGENAPAAEGPSILMWILIAVGVFIIFRIIRSVMSSMSNRDQWGPGGTPNQYGPGNASNIGGPGYGPQDNHPGYGGRGGGMMSGMLGGLFGGMAGGWMYDKMSGGDQARPSEGNFTSRDASSDSLANNSSSPESDSTTYGGDWGDDAGGGDFGGGDFGGDGGGGGDW
jgi:hypothetical protein